MDEIKKYFNVYEGTPLIQDDKEWKCSVHNNTFRLEKAKQQSKLKATDREKIIKHVNDFWERLGIDKVEFPEMDAKNINY